MQSLNSINKGRAAVKYLAEKLGDKIFYLKGGLASPARLGGFVHSKGNSTFDGLHIKDGEVKESGRSVRFGLFLSSADFDKSLGLNAANSPNTSSLSTTKGFIQGRKWDNATPEQRKALANAEYRQAEELKEVLVETIETLKEGYESGELSAEQVVIVISTIFSDAAMNSLGKAAAGLRWFAVNKNGDLATMQDMVNEGIAYKPGEQRLLGNKKTPKDPFVLEHTIPNRSMALRSLDLIFNNKGQQELFAELENYNTAIIPQKVDDQVALNGFKDSMPINHKPGDLPLTTRYKGTGLEFYDAKTGQIVSTGIQHNVNELNDAIEALEPGAKYSKAVPRAVFMVGGPGAGKTNVGKGLKLGRRGYKVINQDLALEPMKEEAGLPANEQQYNKEQRSMRAKLGAAARKAAEAKMQKYKDNRESMVVDGTGASYNATMKKINALREAGYEVSIVFANTSKEEAVARNKARAERALPDMIVERTWDAVQESAKLYKQEFGNSFYELNTNELKMGEDLPQEFLDKLYKDLDAPAAKYSKALNREFNDMLERTTGVKSVKQFSRIQAQMRGRNKGRFKLFIAPGADDFRGLVHYAFAGKGKQGEADMAFLEEKLMIPYFKGVAAIDGMRQQIKRDFRVVTKQFKEEYKLLKKKIGNGMFTYDHALRVYMWDRQGLAIEGLSKRDKKSLLDAIKKNPELVALADALLVVSRRNEWPDPVAHWEGGSVLADLNSMTEKIGRKKFLEEFIENADVIFSEENLNKIEAIYGTRHREALEDSLYAMKNGTNRPSGANRQVNAWLNWINGSTGAIMFFNRRSALLQMLSFTNFINWSDNNMVKAAAAFANQKQYWSDWTMIFNSDKLKERRGGLKQDVSESEIAAAAKGSKNSPQAILSYLLKIGFTPTQIADSMAIATGGAMFYRNRVNTYLKQGMDRKAAEEQAFLDFSMKSDEAQQSSDPALVSQQQRSVLGRLILAFANTPMQYTRLMKKAGQDLINGRGSVTENISKIAYYGVIQNFIFSALQSAMFSMLFDDDEENEDLTEEELEKLAKKEEQKAIRVANSMMDTVLRGSGVYGAVASTIKNTIMEYYKQEERGFMADHTYTLLASAGISPPIQSKLRKIYSAIQTRKFERDNVEQRGWALTADGKLNLGPNWSIFGNVLSGVTNVPLDRVVDEMRSVGEALDERNKAWQRIALALGWKTWDVGAKNEEADLIKIEAKEQRKQEGIEKAKKTREENRKRKEEEFRAMTPEERLEFIKKQQAEKDARKNQ
jgi:dephospho-CoA kinase